MSLEIPDLDDRTYADIVEDARKRIPVYSEQWTDHNASDPGITILELLAWLAETYTYQLDRITDAHRLKYLALLGERPRPPRPASVDLVMDLPEGIVSGIIGSSTKLVATDETNRRYGFETTREIRLTAARLVQVVIDGDRGRLDHSTANETLGMHFAAFDETATEGSAFYLGFEGDPFYGSTELSLAVRLHEADLPEPATHGEAADSWEESDGDEFEPSVEVEWQHCFEYDNWHRDEAWESLKQDPEDDGTDRFYQSGFVTLTRPEKPETDNNWVKQGGKLFGQDEPYRWLRCVLTTDGYEIAPRLDSIAVNIVPAGHRWTVKRRRDAEPLEDIDGKSTSTGLPNQTFRFTSPFVPDAATGDDREVAVIINDHEIAVLVGGEQWERRDDFDTSGPHDKHYVLDPARGEVRFGDGSRGKLPPEGAEIEATRYVIGGGSAGNVPVSATWAFEESGVRLRDGPHSVSADEVGYPTITQPEAATGGVDAESIDEAFDRLLEDRQVPYRAVSLADYEYLAIHTPELRFGRAAARLVTNDPVEKVRPPRNDLGCGHEQSGDIETDRKPKVSDVETPMDDQPAYTEQYDAQKSSREQVTIGGRRTHEAQAMSGRKALGARAVREQRLSKAQSTGESGSGDGARLNKEVQSNAGSEVARYCEPHHEVRVVVVPYSRSSRPEPSTAFRKAVQRHLDCHRLLTDRVIAEHPQYVDVSVDAEVRLESEFGIEDRENAVADTLDTFLDPLHGFEGDGWPFGRTLYRSELYEVIEGVPGVDCVTQLNVLASDGGETDADGNVNIEETALFSPQEHTITAQVATQADQCGRGR